MRSMRLIVLGSGTGVPSLRRNAPGYLLQAAELRVLIDCGSGTLLQLERAGESYRALDVVLITHTHADHIADLVPLLHALHHTPGFERTRGLTVVGPPDVRAWLEHCAGRLLGTRRTFDLEIMDMPEVLSVGGVRVSAGPTRHTDASLAYRFDHGGRSIVITGDAELDDRLMQLSSGADLLVADCSFPDELATGGHMSATACGRLAHGARVGRLLLSHLYPTPQPDALRVEQASAVYSGPIALAEDLLTVEL
jgi:ribonuclease Z